MIAFVIRAQEARIEDTWRSLGMRGTDSNDVIMDDIFVPASRTFPLVPEFEPNLPTPGRCTAFQAWRP